MEVLLLYLGIQLFKLETGVRELQSQFKQEQVANSGYLLKGERLVKFINERSQGRQKALYI